MKTINIKITPTDRIAPHLADKSTTMILNVAEGEAKVVTRDNLAFVDDKSTPGEIVYELVKLAGNLYLKNVPLKPTMKFTQADIDLLNLKWLFTFWLNESFIWFDQMILKGIRRQKK